MTKKTPYAFMYMHSILLAALPIYTQSFTTPHPRICRVRTFIHQRESALFQASSFGNNNNYYYNYSERWRRSTLQEDATCIASYAKEDDSNNDAFTTICTNDYNYDQNKPKCANGVRYTASSKLTNDISSSQFESGEDNKSMQNNNNNNQNNNQNNNFTSLDSMLGYHSYC